MRPITFTRLIVLPEHIVSVKDVYIEDDINYSMVKRELTCKGFISLKFKVNFELESKNYEEKIDVEAILSLAKIDCEQDLKLQFKDYIVNIDDHLLKFLIRYELLGNGEKVIAYKEVGDPKVEDDLMKALTRSDADIKSYSTTSKAVEELLASEEVDVIGAEELVPLTTDSVKSIEEENKEDSNIDVVVEEKPIIIEEEKRFSSTIESNEKKETLFKEKFDISYFFYKIPDENTSYEDLAKKFDVDLSELKKVNKSADLYKGKLVKIVK